VFRRSEILKITSKGRYGLKAMMELYRADRLLKNREIAEMHNIPVKYLEQIINTLKKSNLLKSTRGAVGGYELNRPGSEITLYEILEALEGDLSIMDKSDKHWDTRMGLFWSDIDKDIKKILSITLEDFVKNLERNPDNIMYYI